MTNDIYTLPVSEVELREVRLVVDEERQVVTAMGGAAEVENDLESRGRIEIGRNKGDGRLDRRESCRKRRNGLNELDRSTEGSPLLGGSLMVLSLGVFVHSAGLVNQLFECGEEC